MEVWIQCTVAPFLVLSAVRVYVQTASLRLNINRAALHRQRRSKSLCQVLFTSRLSAHLPVLEEAVEFSSRQKTALTQQCRSATEKRRDKAPPPVAVKTEAPVAVVAVEMTDVTIVRRCLQTLT